MMKKLFVLLILPILSCGNGEGINYNQVYLKLSNTEFLYFYNNSEKHLCLNDEVTICQQKSSLSYSRKNIEKNNDSLIKHIYSFSPDDRILIATTMDGAKNIISIKNDKDEILYVSIYPIGFSYTGNYFISSSQYYGLCDISIWSNIFTGLFHDIDLGYNFDFNDFALNPEICKFSQLLNCLFNTDFGKKELDIEWMKDIAFVCFNSIYSIEEYAYKTGENAQSSYEIRSGK